MAISQLKHTHPESWNAAKAKISQQLLSFHLGKILEVKDPTVMGSELTQLVSDIATEQTIDELPLQYETASLKREEIEKPLIEREYTDVIKNLTDDQKKALVNSVLDILKNTPGTENYTIEILEKEKAKDYNFILTSLYLEKIIAADIKYESAIVFLQEYINTLHGRFRDMNKEGRLTAAGLSFSTQLEKLRLSTEKLNKTPTYDELVDIRNTLNEIVKELNIDNTDATKPGYSKIFSRDRTVLPILIASSIKFFFAASALILAVVALFVPILFIPAVVLFTLATATSIFQKKILEKKSETPPQLANENLAQALPENELANSVPGWSFIKDVFLNHVIPAFTDVFKYSRLLHKSTEYSGIELGNYAANARTLIGYASAKMYGRTGTGAKSRANATLDHNLDNSRLELQSISERPSTQGSQPRPDSQRSWSSDLSLEYTRKSQDQIHHNVPSKVPNRKEYVRSLQNLSKTSPDKLDEPPPPAPQRPRPSSKSWSSSKGK